MKPDRWVPVVIALVSLGTAVVQMQGKATAQDTTMQLDASTKACVGLLRETVKECTR